MRRTRLSTFIDMKERRFLAFSRAVVKHTRAIAIAFLGGIIVALPGLLKSLESRFPAPIGAIEHVAGYLSDDPSRYLWAGTALFAGFFYYACFLAWNEERDKVVRLSPSLTFNFLGYETDESACKFRLEIINGGAQTSIGEWGCRCVLRNNTTLGLSDDYFVRDPMRDEQGINLFIDKTVIKRGGRREGWVKFLPFPECRAIEVTFHDHTGELHVVSSEGRPRLVETNMKGSKDK